MTNIKHRPGTILTPALIAAYKRQRCVVRRLSGIETVFAFPGVVVSRTTHGAVVASEHNWFGEWFPNRMIFDW